MNLFKEKMCVQAAFNDDILETTNALLKAIRAAHQINEIISEHRIFGVENTRIFLYLPREEHSQLRTMVNSLLRFLGLVLRLGYWVKNAKEHKNFSGVGKSSMRSPSRFSKFSMPGSESGYVSRISDGFAVRLSSRNSKKLGEKSHALENFVLERTGSSCKLSVGSAFALVRDKAMETVSRLLHVHQTTSNAMHSPQGSPSITNIDEGSQECGSQDVHYQLTVAESENAALAGTPSFEGLDYNMIPVSLGVNIFQTPSLQTNDEGLNASAPSRPRC